MLCRAASLALLATAGAVNINMGARSAPKKVTGRSTGGIRTQFAGRVVPTGRGAAVAPAEEAPFAEAAQLATDLSITALRLGTCVLMVHHGIDKLEHVDGFTANVVAKFFGFLPGEPSFWTYSAAATQIAGAGLLGIGLLSRPTAAAMSGTMIAAVAFHLLNTGTEGFPLGVPAQHSYNFELAAMYVATLLFFTANGAGRFSVDEQVLGGELKLYKGLVDKVTGKE
jgi:putative oxidoreductase